MYTIYTRTVKDKQLKQIQDIRKGCWINIVDPTHEELLDFANTLKLDPDFLEDGLDENELSSIEVEKTAIYVIVRTPYKVGDQIATAPLMIVITPEYFVTLSKVHVEVLDGFIEGKKKTNTTQKTRFLLSIIHETMNRYELYLKRISKDVKAKKINLQKLENKDILLLVSYEETVNDFIASFVPLNNVLRKVFGGKIIPLYEKDKEVTEDLVDDAKQTFEMADGTLKSIKNIREAYSTILTNNLNKVMKFLAAFTIILTIPTMIASMFGMNIALPFANNSHAFSIILGLSASISIVLWYGFQRMGWL